MKSECVGTHFLASDKELESLTSFVACCKVLGYKVTENRLILIAVTLYRSQKITVDNKGLKKFGMGWC